MKFITNYDRPYNSDEIKSNYGESLYNKLKNDPVHRFRMDTGIELIHKEPTYEEFKRICKNWNHMSISMKKKSDLKSIELFGVDNMTHMKQLESEYNK